VSDVYGIMHAEQLTRGSGQVALARAGNILVARTAFDMSVSLPNSTNPRGFPPWRVQSSTHERTEAKT
jgi:hypothetical protein